MGWLWYWVPYFLSLPAVYFSVKRLVLGSLPSSRWDNEDRALGCVTTPILALAWPIIALIFAGYGVAKVPALYPNARRERKAELMERRRKAQLEAGLKLMREIESRGVQALHRKQQQNRNEHAEWVKESGMEWNGRDLTEPKPKLSLSTGAQRRWDGRYRDDIDDTYYSALRDMAEQRALAAKSVAHKQNPYLKHTEGVYQQPNIDPGTGEILNWNYLPSKARSELLRLDLVAKDGDGRAFSTVGKIGIDYI